MTLSTLGDDGVTELRYLSGLSFVHSGRGGVPSRRVTLYIIIIIIIIIIIFMNTSL